jgi:hypothetical protein
VKHSLVKALRISLVKFSDYEMEAKQSSQLQG